MIIKSCYYMFMAVSHKDWGLQNSRTCLAEISIEIDQFTVVCSVTWPWNGSEAGVDLVLIQTSLLLLCKTSYSNAN